jgi:hypothetical protein
MASVIETGFCDEAAIGSAHSAEGAPKESELSESIRRIIGDSNQVVIYGYKACGYQHVFSALQEDITEGRSKLKGCYDWHKLNLPDIPGYQNQIVKSIDGGKIALFRHPTPYKSGLVTILLENCKRAMRKDPIIPVLFCIDSSQDPRGFSEKNACDKGFIEGRIQRTHTAKELNLVYKLCYDPLLSDDVHRVAKQTFIFVKSIGADRFSPSSLEDTGLRIDDSWDRVLRKEPKDRPPGKPDWRAWLISELAKIGRGSHG